MTTHTPRRQGSHGTRSGRLTWIVATTTVFVLTIWAMNAGGPQAAELGHHSPSSVEAVEGSELAKVSLTAHGAQRIGLTLRRVERVAHPAGTLAVPYAALVYGADGTTWVYATDGDALRFRRQVVEVATVTGDRAILSRGPAVGTEVAGLGSAELYGTEFEVGH